MRKIRLSSFIIYLYFFSIVFLLLKAPLWFFFFRNNFFYRSGNIFLILFIFSLLLFIHHKKIQINLFLLSFFLFFIFISMCSFLINGYYWVVFLLGVISLGKQFVYPLFFSGFTYDRSDIEKFSRFIIFITVGIALLGIIEYLGLRFFEYKLPFLFTSRDFAPKKDYFAFPRISTILDHSNKMANFELIGFNFLISFFYFLKKKKYFFYLLIVLFVIFFSFSRQAVVGIFITVILFLFITRSKKIFCFLIFSVAIPLMVNLSLFLEKFLDFFVRFERDFIGEGFYFRAHAFFTSFKVLRDHLLFGVGPGRFGSPITKIFPSVVEKKYALFVGPFRYLNTMDMFMPVVYSEIGILGFLTFFSFYMYILLKGYDNYRFFLKKDKLISALNLGIFLEMVSLLFIMLVSYSVNTIIISLFFFGAVGIIFRYSHDEKRKFKV